MLLSKSAVIALLLFATVSLSATSQAEPPAWHKVAYQVPAKASSAQLAHKHYDLFAFFLSNALHGEGKTTFLQVTEQVRNKIQWRDKQGDNAYLDAFVRSYPFVKNVDLQGMPDSILLIAYLESQWHGKKGKKSADYGYWQMTPEVLKEIQTLDYVSDAIKTTGINKLRSNASLSTQAAQAHLHRYHFYFADVAGFAESDAWLLTFTAYNWGSGNVKRLIADMESRGIAPNFANFYHELYAQHLKQPSDRSLKAAVEYVPSLWNIAQLLKDAH
ncbi:transglycosylase SLT domain-containing protein [Thiothrix winogradskyi]|uniref:Transglycosylase SLT domain-containing protein n=1 Tax=Thiothrix winogradskyi TaxID=96472 RepID=A0ABY3SYL3_9GAMM|nr:transglycosylase SLT domain-containing protein [Thiothrix winogradskyi]UJS24591.1 transglycosylase SLT domain-containing protein [Thiothrix winogradskyi]